LFLNVRRNSSVPDGPFATAAALRTVFGALPAPTVGSIRSRPKWAVPEEAEQGTGPRGPEELSGPGAPSVEALPPTGPPAVETRTKSAALSVVSCVSPFETFLTKLCSEVLPATAGRLLPSRSRSQLPPAFAPKPTASRRFAELMLARSPAAKSPTLPSFWMSPASAASPAA
jgi:hypothetical protein